MTQKLIGQLVNRHISDYLIDPKIYRESNKVVSNPDLYMGLELEIEGWGYANRFPGLQLQADGSLRNNGVEWITYPTKLRHLEPLLRDFFTKFPLTQEANYSDRTSVHVHVNVQDFTPNQLATLVLLYQLFERLLFNFVSEERRSNIFCVPWYQAGITNDLVNRIESWDYFHLYTWQKYTALNLLAIEQKGTVEYRMLEGTCDVDRIMVWCNMLGAMHAYAKDNDLQAVKDTIVTLNTSSAYDVFLQNVFGEWSAHLLTGAHVIAMEEGVLDCKFMLSKPVKKAAEYTQVPNRTEVLRQRAADFLANARAEQQPIEVLQTIAVDPLAFPRGGAAAALRRDPVVAPRPANPRNRNF